MEILTPITKMAILLKYNENNKCLEFETEFNKFHELTSGSSMFAVIGHDIITELVRNRPKWKTWLRKTGFISAPITHDEAATNWANSQRNCPICGSTNFDSYTNDPDTHELVVEYSCSNCNNTWQDEYSFSETYFDLPFKKC